MKISLQEEEEEVKEGVVGKGNSVATFLTTVSFLRSSSANNIAFLHLLTIKLIKLHYRKQFHGLLCLCSKGNQAGCHAPALVHYIPIGKEV